MGDWILFYIWLGGFILSLPIMIYWMNYKEPDGRTVVDMRRIVLILCGAIIGNIGIVMLFLMAAGVWIFVKIGEWISPLGDITFYESGKEESKEKKKASKEQREETDNWWETNQEYKQMCSGITSHLNYCRVTRRSPEKTFIHRKPLYTQFFLVKRSSACSSAFIGFDLYFRKKSERIHVYSIDFYDSFMNKEARKAKLSISIQGLGAEEYLAIIKTVIETGNFNIKRKDIIEQKK